MFEVFDMEQGLGNCFEMRFSCCTLDRVRRKVLRESLLALMMYTGLVR